MVFCAQATESAKSWSFIRHNGFWLSGAGNMTLVTFKVMLQITVTDRLPCLQEAAKGSTGDFQVGVPLFKPV